MLRHRPVSNILYRCIRTASAAEAIIEGKVTSCLPHIRCHRPLLRVHVRTSRVLVSPLGLDTPSKAGEERGLADQVARQVDRQAVGSITRYTQTQIACLWCHGMQAGSDAPCSGGASALSAVDSADHRPDIDREVSASTATAQRVT